MRTMGIDVGLKKSYYAVIEDDNGSYKVVDFGIEGKNVDDVDMVGVEVPDAKNFGRGNTPIILSIFRCASQLILRYAMLGYETYDISFSEWAKKNKSRSGIDSRFLRIFKNAKRKGKRIYVDDKPTNEHIRDAAMIAYHVHKKYGNKTE